MCDEHNLDEFQRRGLNRRQFGAMGAMATLAACAPMEGAATGGSSGGLSESEVTVTTPDGALDAFFVHPASGAHPGVIIWPDIAGLREAFRLMARRLAGAGYAVLVANPYYRSAKAPQFADFKDWMEQGGFQKVGPWREQLTAEAVMRDAKAMAGWLDGQASVDTARGIGTQGYCMGGPFTVWSAAGAPDRITAAASFHGGGLVTDADTSPHKLLGQTQARFLIAIAQNDDAKSPDEKSILYAEGEKAGRPTEVEVYPADHGWTVPDSPVYAEAAAERAWGRLLATYAML